MARVASSTQRRDGVYGWLHDREEQAVARNEDYVARDGSVYCYPRHRLDALRDGRPVSVPTWVFPKEVQRGLPRLPRDRRLGQRAMVFPDDTVTVEAETAGRWMEESGLNDDTFQGQARFRWRMDDISWETAD
jgi:hypothetical protein